eukprot:CAMPEP_0184864278 /NCGR_PEP_ID=MMETSP0580-20130426/14382_1 /TAXON_ID=1118495 /ORGANISM="Dactyliosolen fragilissimus" /LENGTH=269 /DNA_ID=CAMNT_0027362989 /DNA_START=156 /DNA_END=965 /DNA_ORIENTATION=+
MSHRIASSSDRNIESDDSQAFVPKDKYGNELPMSEYLKYASLSPWVPCPDVVARRLLDIAKVGPDDVHYELGSGDGRVNFHAADPPYSVKKTVGIDIDHSLIETSKIRLGKRYPQPQNIEFVSADLLGNESVDIWDKIKNECTVLTMYFVEDALQQLKPIIERSVGNTDMRIITVGYQMHGWEPEWVENILGLQVNLYVLNKVEDSPQSFLETKNVTGKREEDENSKPIDKKDISVIAAEIGYDKDHDIDFHWDDFDDNLTNEEKSKEE